jgi:multiple sugar transport system permease protein
MSVISKQPYTTIPAAQPVLADPRREDTQRKPLLARIIFFVLVLGCMALFFSPFIWLVMASLKERAQIFSPAFLPNPVAWQNYVTVWQEVPMLTWLGNSLLVSVLAAVAVTVSSSLVAFGFAYYRFRGRNLLFGLVLATMMLPGVVTMVPSFLIWQQLGFVNTHVPLWAGNLFGSAFYIFLIRQFYLGLPREMFEAAKADGANALQLWRHLALPLSRTALIVVFVFEFKAAWTDLVKPLIYLQDASLFTLPRGLKVVLDQFGQGGEMQWEIVLAASVIITVPMLIIFFIGQRYFMDDLATSGMKR